MANAWESYVAKSLLCNTVPCQVSCILQEPVLCVLALSAASELSSSSCLASDVPVESFLLDFLKKGEASGSSERNFWPKRTESLSNGEKKREEGWKSHFLSCTSLTFFISFSTNLNHKFMFITSKCVVLYVVLLIFILLLLFISHGCLAFSL